MIKGDNLAYVLRAPLGLLALSGCALVLRHGLEETGHDRWGRARKIARVSAAIVAAVNQVAEVARCLAFFVYLVPVSDDTKSFFIQSYLFIVYGSLVYVFESLTCHFYYGRVMEALRHYCHRFGFRSDLTVLARYSAAGTYFLTTAIALNSLAIHTGFLFWEHSFVSFPWLNQLDPGSVVAGYAIVCSTIAAYLPIAGFFVLYATLVELVKCEFKGAAEEMLDKLSQESNDEEMEEAFSQVRSRHQALCDIVCQLTLLTRLYAGVSLMSSILVMFFAIYTLGSGQLPRAINITETSVLLFTLIPILYICIGWGRLPAAINLLTVLCSSRRVGINLYGLFILDSSSVLMVMGSILTYGIVVLQFQTDKETSGHINDLLNTSIS